MYSNPSRQSAILNLLNIHLNPCQSPTEALQRSSLRRPVYFLGPKHACEFSIRRQHDPFPGASYYHIYKLIGINLCTRMSQMSGNEFMIVWVLHESGNIQSVDGHILFPPGCRVFICKWNWRLWSASDVWEGVKVFPGFSECELHFLSILSSAWLIFMIESLWM